MVTNLDHTTAHRGTPFTESKERAIVVAIENTGQLPFPLDVSDELRRGIERFVDTITEVVAERHARNLFTGYYDRVEILADTDCIKDQIRAKIAELGRDHVLDLAILGHGALDPAGSGQAVLILHGGVDHWRDNAANLRTTDVRAWKKNLDFQDLKLGLVYMMNCHGSAFNDAWRDLGFKTVIGSCERNWMPEPMFTFFWTRFRGGEPAQVAAEKAWEDSKLCWQPLHRPVYKLVTVPEPPYVHLDFEENAKIIESRPVVSGDSNLVFKDDVRPATGMA